MSGTLRLIAGGLLALIACYIGMLIKRRYRDRERFYKSAYEFTQTLNTELSFKKTPIPTVAQSFLQGRKGDFEHTLEQCMQLLKEGKDSIYTFEKVEIPILKKQEKKEVIQFLMSLGKSSLSDQLAAIGREGDAFKLKYDQCAADSKRMGGMYFKLFVLLGLAIILILA